MAYDDHSHSKSRPERRVLTVALIAVALGMFLMQLDATVVNLALPTIAADLDSSVTGLQWVIDGYTLPLAAFLLIGGRLGDRYGHRRIFLIGLVVFGLGSILCAVVSSITTLIVARVFQGLGAALELPASLALLAQRYPDPALRARAIGIWASVGGLALAVGPLAGGPLVDHLGWRSIFLINVPIVFLGLILAATGFRQQAPQRKAELNVPSQFFGTAVLTAITYAIIDFRQLSAAPVGWGAVIVVLLVAAAGFIISERRSASPLLPGNVIHHRTFTAASLAALAMGFVLFGVLFSYSLYFQNAWADSAAGAGLRFLPLVLAFLIVGPLAGRFGASQRPYAVTTTGLVLLAAASITLASLPTEVPYLVIAIVFVITGIGYGLLTTTLAIIAVGSLPAEQHGLGSAVNNTARQLGGVIGVALTGNLLHVPATLANPATGANIASAVLAVAAAIAVATLKSRTPKVTQS